MPKTPPHKRKKKPGSAKVKKSPNTKNVQVVSSEEEVFEPASERSWAGGIIVLAIVLFGALALLLIFNNGGDELPNLQGPDGVSSEGQGVPIESGSGLGQLGQSNSSSIQNNTNPMGGTGNPENSNGASNGLQSPVDKCAYQQYEQAPLSPECITQ